MSKKVPGFTLIELMVVIAIIGVIATIIIGSVNIARLRGADAAIKADLKNAITSAELFYTNNSNSYLPPGGSTYAQAVCPAFNAAATNMVGIDPAMSSAIAQAQLLSGYPVVCYNSATAWGVSAVLRSNPLQGWCVDSTGTSRLETLTSAGGAVSAMTTLGVCL